MRMSIARFIFMLLNSVAYPGVFGQTLCETDGALLKRAGPALEEAIRGAERMGVSGMGYAERYKVPSDRFLDLTRTSQKAYTLYLDIESKQPERREQALPVDPTFVAVTFGYLLRSQATCAGLGPELSAGLIEIAEQVLAQAATRLRDLARGEVYESVRKSNPPDIPLVCSAFVILLKQRTDEWRLREWLGEDVAAAKVRTALMERARSEFCREN